MDKFPMPEKDYRQITTMIKARRKEAADIEAQIHAGAIDPVLEAEYGGQVLAFDTVLDLLFGWEYDCIAYQVGLDDKLATTLPKA